MSRSAAGRRACRTRGSRSLRAAARRRPSPARCGRSAARRRRPAPRARPAEAARPSPRASASGSARRRRATAGPSIRAAASCQPTARARRMLAGSYRSPPRRQVDPADEGDPVVDDDRLLVVAVQRPLVRVERALDRACRRRGGLASLRTVARDGRKSGSGAPAQASTRTSTPLGQLCEQVAQDQRVVAAREREVGREVPAGEVDVRRAAASSSRCAAALRRRR